MNNLMTKSFLSYVDLKKAAEKDVEQDLEMGNGGGKSDPKMEAFLEEAEKVKAEMASIKDILITLEASNEESKSLHKPEALKALRGRINADVVTVLRKAKAIKARLELMDRATAENRRLSSEMGTPIDRTRTCVTNGLRKKLKELMMEFQALRQKMMSEYKETVGRCYYTVTGEYPEDDMIEKIISNGVGEGEILTHAVQEHGRGKVLETVIEIQGRHDAAKEIERSLLELHQVFLDMAVMVEAQGEQMDNIEHHVINASHYVQDGTKNLKQAKVYQRGSRKCMCIGIIALLVIILLIVIPILASFTHS
ncbi:syntaxin-related protein KNOLLE [Amaranthus tricolor]|uniref:syntaxin-related protein KNOLLE n=1 Tax=Amaranthus tricolor TaxID=29722 RepID=UPI00258F6AA8|nr:syntaxin-related protein KNOLLE [Amaranthus tricolor]XP_057547150.1 syntaxin-related protein KNOLLE [Amaranthus tricolor]